MSCSPSPLRPTAGRLAPARAADDRNAPVLPLADGRGATYVAWTGRARSGRRAVKFARVGPGASRRPLVLSRERGAVLVPFLIGLNVAVVATVGPAA